MDLTCQVTPEMVGLSWRRTLLNALRDGVIVLLSFATWSNLVHRPMLLRDFMVALGVAVLSPFFRRSWSRTTLRLTDDSIEQSDGLRISKDSIARVDEHTNDAHPGLEITGT